MTKDILRSAIATVIGIVVAFGLIGLAQYAGSEISPSAYDLETGEILIPIGSTIAGLMFLAVLQIGDDLVDRALEQEGRLGHVVVVVILADEDTIGIASTGGLWRPAGERLAAGGDRAEKPRERADRHLGRVQPVANLQERNG